MTLAAMEDDNNATVQQDPIVQLTPEDLIVFVESKKFRKLILKYSFFLFLKLKIMAIVLVNRLAGVLLMFQHRLPVVSGCLRRLLRLKTLKGTWQYFSGFEPLHPPITELNLLTDELSPLKNKL